MDRYQRVRKIGEGAFGKAILVRKKQSNQQYVVKEINIIRMSSKEREDARKEVAVLAQLKHPNIITYVESFEEAGTLFIVMDYCSGGDLYAKINSQQGRLFSEEQVLTWFVQLCLAMKHIHDRKILHRDIKSQNIFLTSSGTIQLGDFGIAKVLNNTVELARTCIGTPYYLSPEIVENKPYNNKSDIWSLGCVLYELTTLKHAFEAGNMKNLVLKIIRGSYPPVPPQYSYDLRGLIAQLFKRAPRDRPSINSVLKKNFIMERVRRLMSAEQIADEFSHTVMHGARLAKALPPAPRPSSAPKKSNTPRPGSAGRARYNPASVYGVPVGRKSQNRSSGDAKKKGGPSGGGVNHRPLPIPGQQEWEQRKKDMVDREQKRREENKRKYEEQVARRHQNLVEKQKMDCINRAREDGWKQLIKSGDEKDEARPATPQRGGEPRPLPVPRQKPDPAQPNYLENRGPREPGNYDNYIAYLDKLKMQRQERERELNQRKENYMPAPRPLMNNPAAPPAVQAAQAINQANYDRQKGFQAAERARIVEDYVQRRQAAAANKARGLADLHGGRPPSARSRASPDPAHRPVAGRPPLAQGRNKEEQEYLEKLRQIRENNMRERRNLIQQKAGIPSPSNKEAEERRKKAEGLKQQAEDWAKKKKDQLEKDRQQLLKQPQPAGSRPNSAKANMTPAPAVPISGMLQLIGANDKAAAPPAAPGEAIPEEDPQKNVQQKKTDILKRLNEKPPSRGKWGGDDAEAAPPAAEEEVQMRRPWGEGVISPLADPESARPQWSEEQLRLSDLPLEQTGSAMEATSARDQVVRHAGEPAENPKSARNQWGRPGSTVVKALNQLPICEGTVSLDSTASQDSAESVTSPPVTKPAIGFTITLSDSPAPTPTLTPTPAPTPAVKPPIRSGTIVLKTADAKTSAAAATVTTATTAAAAAISPESLGVVAGKDEPVAGETEALSVAAEPLIGEAELPGSNRFVESNETDVKIRSGGQRLSTVVEASSDFVASENDSTVMANVSESSETSDRDETAQYPPTPERAESEKKKADAEDGGRPKPALKPKPEVKPKPAIAQKPVLLPKPKLLSKPDEPYHFSEQAPEVISSKEEGQAVFSKAPETATAPRDEDKPGSAEREEAERAQSSHTLQKGLCTGNFDMKDVQLLRTCSEPDLANLFRATANCIRATLNRHKSLDLSSEAELQQADDPSTQIASPRGEGLEEASSPLPPDEKESEEKEGEVKKDGDDHAQEGNGEDDAEEEEGDDDNDEEEEDLKNMMATMQSLLLDDDGDADEEEESSPKVQFSLSSDSETTLKDDSGRKGNKDKDPEENGDTNEESNSSEEDESAGEMVREQLKGRCKSDGVLEQPHKREEEEERMKEAGDHKEDEEEEEAEEEEEEEEGKLMYNTADILTLNDSDDETVFGDDDEDIDLFSRLEQQREELEKELGFEKFIEIYKTVQALQEDEDENMEEGARIVINMLGAEKQHLYPRIFQLVMADTVFTEDNA